VREYILVSYLCQCLLPLIFNPMKEPVTQVCSKFHKAVELIGARWSGAIIQSLMQGPTRYGTIRAAVPEISDRMLSERLRILELEGIIGRTVVPETPVRVEYELTEKGRGLESALTAIATWAERWGTDGHEAIVHPAAPSPAPSVPPGHPALRPQIGPRIRPKSIP
jgi:DNA-binding HxlR family transcriptional regulator